MKAVVVANEEQIRRKVRLGGLAGAAAGLWMCWCDSGAIGCSGSA
jgi:hypothetical protein